MRYRGREVSISNANDRWKSAIYIPIQSIVYLKQGRIKVFIKERVIALHQQSGNVPFDETIAVFEGLYGSNAQLSAQQAATVSTAYTLY